MSVIVAVTCGDPVVTQAYEWRDGRWTSSPIYWRRLVGAPDGQFKFLGQTGSWDVPYPRCGGYSAELVYELTEDQYDDLKRPPAAIQADVT